jgi:tRNA(fMet)-specific endonuclease VapC
LNKALLDTDTLSEIGKGIDPNIARNATAYRRAFGRYTLSVVTVMEIVSGHQRKQAAERIARFLAAIAQAEVIPFDQDAAELAGRITGDLHRTSQTIGMADPMIAAIAITNGLELVTGNTGHFQRIQQLGYQLTVVNWRH